MTDLECKKICKLLDIKEIWLNDEGVVCIRTFKQEIGHVFIYEDNFSSALPLRVMKLPSKHSSSQKNLLEMLLKQSADGIKSVTVGLLSDSPHHFPGKRKLIDAYESVESLLVQYDLKFSCKKRKSRS